MACDSQACQSMDRAFVAMKIAAVEARWPADLSPQVVAIDNDWQKLRQDPSPNLAYVAKLEALARSVTTALRGRQAGATKAGAAAAATAALLPSLSTARRVAPLATVPTAPALLPPALPPPEPPVVWYKSPWAIGGGAALAVAIVLGFSSALSSRARPVPSMMGRARRRRRYR